jgi:hypothetical protein
VHHRRKRDEVALEATTNAWHVHDLLSRHAGWVLVANPAKTALTAQSQVKSDRVDAQILALAVGGSRSHRGALRPPLAARL